MTHAVPCCVSSLKVGSKVYWSISLSSAFVKCQLSMLGLHSRVRAEVKWNEVKSSQKYLAIMNLCKRRVVICFRCAFPPLFLMYSRTLVSFETLNKMEKHKVMKKLVLFFSRSYWVQITPWLFCRSTDPSCAELVKVNDPRRAVSSNCILLLYIYHVAIKVYCWSVSSALARDSILSFMALYFVSSSVFPDGHK